MNIKICRLDKSHSVSLSRIMSADKELQKKLYFSQLLAPISPYEYFSGCLKWEEKKIGQTYSIFLDNEIIGSISFSRYSNDTANIGYWISSDLWGQGITKNVFPIFLKIVKENGFNYARASILKDNIASINIWRKYTKKILEDKDRYYPIINLSNIIY